MTWQAILRARCWPPGFLGTLLDNACALLHTIKPFMNSQSGSNKDVCLKTTSQTATWGCPKHVSPVPLQTNAFMLKEALHLLVHMTSAVSWNQVPQINVFDPTSVIFFTALQHDLCQGIHVEHVNVVGKPIKIVLWYRVRFTRCDTFFGS
jgi:hypothetical protein